MENIKTGRYVLNNIALRSWWLVPRAYVTGIGEEQRQVKSLTKEEFEVLKICDGKIPVPDSATLNSLLERKMIRPSTAGEGMDHFLMLREYNNRYFRNMTLNITERCNFNCLHCYEAVDNQISRSEMSLADCRKLLKEARDCGIQNVKITGGEPLIHPDFLEIVKSVYENEMTVDRINTNVHFMNEKLADEIREIDPKIMFNVSYDGAGYHDWMRNKKGAEKDLLSKIRLLVDKGFHVRAAMTLNRVNKDAAMDSLFRMEELGVHEFRIIRTSETPRWKLNAKDSCLTFTEYYDAMTELCRRYAAENHKIDLNIFHFAKVFNRYKCYSLATVAVSREKYDPSRPFCGIARENVTVTPSGDVFPCTPSPGVYKAGGINFGNVFDNGLKPLLQDGKFLNFACTGVRAIEEHDPKCGSCRFFKQCTGGCRLIAFGLTGDLLAHDPMKCAFFEGEYYKKLEEALPGYRCMVPVEI